MSPSVTVRLLATQSDARLVELARNGHERAFEALVQRYRRPLLGYCRRVLLPEARAEDALQQALLQAWLALQRGDDVRDARAWLYRIVHNTALNALRGSGYDYAELSEAITGAGAPQEDLDRRIAVREALAGLAALPEQQREALMRTAVEGASHAAAAAEMGLSEGALRGLVHRARVSLRAGLTAITPMPLASWAAGAAGHGAAVADLAVGGGSAGLAGLLAKGGAAMLAAGVVAAGVGGVDAVHHLRHHARSRHVRLASPAADGSQARVVAAPAPTRAAPLAAAPHDLRHGRRPAAALTPVGYQAPGAPVSPRDGGGVSPRQGTSEGDGGHAGPGGGTGPGERQGSDPLPGSGTAPAPGDGESGDGGHGGTSTGGSGDGGSGDGGSGGSGPSGGDDGQSGGGSTGSQGDGTSGGSHDGESGSGTAGGSGTTTTSGGGG